MPPNPPSLVKMHVPLAPRTTLGVGGPARYFADCASRHEVTQCLDWANDQQLEVFVLGGGSNLLVADQGFDGLVLHPTMRGITLEQDGSATLVTAGAATPWDALVAQSVASDLAGLECLSGIPGDTGACPVQNIGAYGQEISETLLWVEAVDRQTGNTTRITATACHFEYRSSLFKTAWRDRYVILNVAFRLIPHGRPRIRYNDLARALERHTDSKTPTLQAIRDAVLAIRASKSMLFDLEDPNGRSAGSFFTNPVVTRNTARHVQEIATQRLGRDTRVPTFPAEKDLVKLPAAWLIEAAGFHRGYRWRHAALSSKHALAIVNTGGANATDILSLATRIRQAVMDTFGIALIPEPRCIGFRDQDLKALGATTAPEPAPPAIERISEK